MSPFSVQLADDEVSDPKFDVVGTKSGRARVRDWRTPRRLPARNRVVIAPVEMLSLGLSVGGDGRPAVVGRGIDQHAGTVGLDLHFVADVLDGDLEVVRGGAVVGEVGEVGLRLLARG